MNGCDATAGHKTYSSFRSAEIWAVTRWPRRWNAVLAGSLIAACVCLSFPGDGAAVERTVDLELVLAADISRSMDLEEAMLVRQGFVRAIRHQDVADAIQRGPHGRIAVTYIEWGQHRYQRTRVDWAEISDASSAAAFALAVEQSSVMLVEWTSISGAIDFGTQRFKDNGFDGARRIIDISGDGPNNSGDYVNFARDRALANGIVINGLPIINDRPQLYGYPRFPDLDLYYEDCVIGGPGSFIVVADGFKDFARAVLRKLVMEIAGATPPRPLLRRVAARPRPSCDAGEIQHREWLRHQKWPDPLYDF